MKTKSSSSLQIRVYSPEPALKHPGVFFRDMFKDISSSGELAMALAKRDISAQYRQSILGYVWAFLPVLGTTFVFLFLKSGGAFETGASGMAYPVYVFVGTMLWQLFADAVNGPLKMVTTSRAMLVKINFPREALILGGMLMTGFNFVIRLIILIPALGYFAWKGVYTFEISSLWLFPLGALSIVILGYTIGILLTPLGMLYKDIQMAMTMIMMFWMFISPVIVSIPESGLVSEVMKWNPVSPLLDTTRSWLVGIEPMLIGHYIGVMIISLVFLMIGWILYRVALPHIIARLGM
jgi:lipopolysaccharide transport system permease protein